MHCLASFAHATPLPHQISLSLTTLELVEHAVRVDHGAANAAVAHEQVAAEPDPHHRRVAARGCAGTPRGRRRRAAVKNRSAGPPTCHDVCFDIGSPRTHARSEIGRQRQRVHGRLRSIDRRRLQRSERGRQLRGHCADAAGAHRHDHIAVARNLDQRARQILDLLDEHAARRGRASGSRGRSPCRRRRRSAPRRPHTLR